MTTPARTAGHGWSATNRAHRCQPWGRSSWCARIPGSGSALTRGPRRPRIAGISVVAAVTAMRTTIAEV